MGDQDSQRGSFWTSLPGILTGAAALITAVSGLAIWHNNSAAKAAPTPAPIVQQSVQPAPAPAPVLQQTGQPQQKVGPVESGTTTPIGSQQWCSDKYSAWHNKKTQTGVDDAGLRKEIVQAHCNQFGIKLGRIKAAE